MTDMRATERLLEVIEEAARAIDGSAEHHDFTAVTIIEAVTELRRRGDTLVRRDDLRRSLEKPEMRQTIDHHRYYEDDREDPENVRDIEAFDRIEAAIGGKLR